MKLLSIARRRQYLLALFNKVNLKNKYFLSYKVINSYNFLNQLSKGSNTHKKIFF